MERYQSKLKEFGITSQDPNARDSKDEKLIYQLMMRFAKSNSMSSNKADFIITRLLDIFYSEVQSHGKSSELSYLKAVDTNFDKRFK